MDLSKIKPTAAMAVCLAALNMCVVMTMMYLFNPDFFLTTDIFRLIILSGGIYSIPFLIAYIAIFAKSILELNDRTSDEINKVDHASNTFETTLLTLIMGAVALSLKYFWSSVGVKVIILTYVILGLLVIILLRLGEKKKE